MKLHRFYQPNIDLDNKILAIQDEEFLHQLSRVLRFSQGDKLVLFDGKLNEVFCEIVEVNEKQGRFKVLKIEKNTAEPVARAQLYCGVLKKENFELVCQKATEIGIKKIVPIITQRTVKTGLKQDRVKKIIIEAAEQSGRGIVPELSEPVEFQKAVGQTKPDSLNILFDQSGQGFDGLSIKDYDLLINLWVGPEGGWTSSELKLAEQNDFQIISLGKTTLRAETAAIVGSFQVITKQPAGN